MKIDLLKDEIDVAETHAQKIIDSIIDQVVFGPMLSEQQIRIVWANIEAKAHKFANE